MFDASTKRPGGVPYVWLIATVLALAGAGAGWWLWRDASDMKADGTMMIVASGDTAGWIVPCGCASNQSGGLMRRGTYVERLRDQGDVVLVDAGGAPGGTSAYERIKFEAILDGEVAMGIAAHNLGGGEVALGPGYLRQVAAEKRIPFVSANVHDAEGKPIAEPVRIVEAGGQRIAIMGVLSERYATEAVRVDEPRATILAQLDAIGDRYDVLLILAYLPEEELRALTHAVPEADVIIGGPTGQNLPIKQVGPALLTSATNKAKFLVELRANGSASDLDWEGRVIEMGGDLPDNEGQVANFQRYLATLAERDFSAAETGLAPPLPAGLPDDYRVAGNESCRECHEADCRLWDDSKHAHAFDTLAGQGKHVDPYCQQCHTTGYGLPGGFNRMADSAVHESVGCENCHGPSWAHVNDYEIKTPYDAADQCIRCHDQENSPNFDYESYWARIEHGEPAVVDEAKLKPLSMKVGNGP